MKYSLRLLITAVVSGVCFSCTDFQEVDAPEALTLDVSELAFSAGAGSKSVTVRSGSRWNVNNLPDWVSVQSITSWTDIFQWGVTFAVTENNEYDREGIFSVQASTNAETITVTQQGKKGKYVAVEFISVPGTLTLTEGDTQKLTPTITPSNASVKTVTWKSSAPSVATVDENGIVTAVAEGSATITVTSDDSGMSAICSVTVKAKVIGVTGVSLNKTSMTLTEGDTETLTATVTPANATDKTVTWSSSNTSVATVSSTGVVTAVKAGSATITVTTKDGSKKATCAVTVNAKVIHVTSVSLNKTSLSLKVGDTENLATA